LRPGGWVGAACGSGRRLAEGGGFRKPFSREPGHVYYCGGLSAYWAPAPCSRRPGACPDSRPYNAAHGFPSGQSRSGRSTPPPRRGCAVRASPR